MNKKIMKKNTLLVSASAIFVAILSGCTAVTTNPSAYHPQAPAVENFRPSYQQQLNASAHWSIIASDIVNQLRGTLRKHHLQDQPVYLNLYSEDSAFTEAFNDFLTTHLVKSGTKVTKNQHNALVYNYKVQPVKFRSFRTMARSNKFKLTTLASGLIVAREAADILSLGTTKVSDVLIASAAFDTITDDVAPQLELIISGSVLNNDIYIHKSTDIYYANQLDTRLYKADKKDESQPKRADVFNDPFYYQ